MMRSYLLAAALSIGLVFGMSNAGAKNSQHLKAYFGTKCFTPLELAVDHHDNVFAFFRNAAVRDLSLMPYRYWALEVYGLQPKQADAMYNKYNTMKTLTSINSVISDLEHKNFSCHVRGATAYWPFIIYYNCIAKERAGIAKS